ncbi:MAG: AMP-binding protein [Patulibacter sp.]
MIDANLLPANATTLGELLARHAAERGATAWITRVDDERGDASLSYADAVADGRALAGWLQQTAGLRPGDRVALLVDNGAVLEFFATLAACWLGGYVAVPVNARNAPPEIAFILEHADAQVVVAESRLRERLTASGARLDRVLVDRATAETDDTTVAEAIAAGLPLTHPAPGPDDRCAILYTSGTTGRPKGAVFRHGSAVANAEILRSAFGTTSASRLMMSVPVFTSTGTHTFPLPYLAAGGTLLFETAFDPAAWSARVTRTGPTAYFGVPAMLALLLDRGGEAAATSGIREIMFGGSQMMLPLAERLLATFPGAGLRNIYGMTESGPSGATLDPADAIRKLATVGRPMPGVEVRVLDPEGNDVAAGTAGEITLRTAGLMEGYLDDPAATERVIDADGWFRTGDVGVLDAEGFLSVVDRTNDMVVRGGFNIYPAEVESAVLRHDAVAEVAVTGRPHPVLGEDLVAWVVVREGAEVTAEQLRATCAAQVADYKCPRDFRFVDALPRNAMGKLLRRELRAQLVDAG